MARAAAPVKKRGRGGFRLIIALLVIVVIIVGLIIGLNLAAQAETNVGATLTVFVPTVSVSRGCAGYSIATSGMVVQPGDSLKTDAHGRAQITFPDGTITRLANNSDITLSAAHFGKDGNLHDASILEKLGRTLNTVQHLASGATFQVVGNTTTASVRGTVFEVAVNASEGPSGPCATAPAAPVVIKLFSGGLDVDGKSHVHLNAGQQVSVDAQGNIGAPGPIQPDPNDPFGLDIQAINLAQQGTTPGTEQDYVGPTLHNGEQQQYTYSFAGGNDIKAALTYPGSLMKLKIEAPDGHVYDSGPTPSPIVMTIIDPPSGIFKFDVIGISGLDPTGETPYLVVASIEPCQALINEQNGAVRHAYTGQSLAAAATAAVSGLSNVQINILGNSTAGAVLQGSASFNGLGLSGTLLLYAHGGNLGVIALAASALGATVPAQQAMQQIASALGDDPANLGAGFHIDRLFTCNGVMMIDGRISP